MDFLNHREGGMVFLLGFPPFSLTVYSNWTVEIVRGCVRLKKYKSQGKTVEVTVNCKKENSEDFEDFCLDFVQEFGLCLLAYNSVYQLFWPAKFFAVPHTMSIVLCLPNFNPNDPMSKKAPFVFLRSAGGSHKAWNYVCCTINFGRIANSRSVEIRKHE